MNGGAIQLLLSAGIPAVIATLIGTVFLIGPQRKKYAAESRGTDVGSASTLSGAALAQMNAAIERATRAERKADEADARLEAADRRVDELEEAQHRDHDQIRALRLDLRDLQSFLTSPAVAALLKANGLVPPQARVAYDSNDDLG